MSNPWILACFGCGAALYLGQLLALLFHLRWMRRLPPLEALKNDAAARETGVQAPLVPRVSVVLAARDEEGRIESTVRRLLAQAEVDLEVIAVDDRSSDRTGDILRRLAGEDARVKALRVDALPDGWLGKCYACHAGAGAARGDWFLFTDADCWLKEDVLARALLVARRDDADHVTLTPGIATGTFAARAWHVAFLLTLGNWLSGVNRDRPRAYLGMGAFNLVRAPAYRECGGYEALRLTVLDDLRLGLLLRRARKRTRGFIGGDDVACDWGATARGMIRVMEKNYFAAMDYRTGAALGATTVGFVAWGGAFLGAISGTWAGGAMALALLSWSLPAAVVASRLGWSRWTGLATPFVFPLLFYAMLRSACITLRRGGVRWRDTFYPLALLRRGGVR